MMGCTTLFGPASSTQVAMATQKILRFNYTHRLSRNNSRKQTLLDTIKRLRHANIFTLSFHASLSDLACHHKFGVKCEIPHSTEKQGQKDIFCHKHSVAKRVRLIPIS